MRHRGVSARFLNYKQCKCKSISLKQKELPWKHIWGAKDQQEAGESGGSARMWVERGRLEGRGEGGGEGGRGGAAGPHCCGLCPWVHGLPLYAGAGASCPAPEVALSWPCSFRCCLLVTGSQAPDYCPTIVADEEEVTTRLGG